MHIRRLGSRGQNEEQPASEEGPRPGQRYVFQEGDTLRDIAVAAYKNPDLADQIAEANGLEHGQVPRPGDVLQLPKQRRMLFGDRLTGRSVAIGGVPLVAVTGVGVESLLSSGDGTPVTAGDSNRSIVRSAPPTMSLPEALASRGFMLRADDPGGLPDLPTPQEIRKGERLLKKLGWPVGRVDGQLTPLSQDSIGKFQDATGLVDEAHGVLTPKTLRKLDSTAERVEKRGRGYLTQGMRGEKVKKLQQRLKRLGDFRGPVTGIYDQATVDAVLSFRDRHPKLQNGIESWGPQAQKALDAELANIAHDPYRERVKPSKKRERLDRATARAARNGGIGPGSPREVIKYFQQHLTDAGYNPNRTDGIWFDDAEKERSHTQAMAKQFQRRSGIPETERFGLRMWNKLEKTTIETRSGLKPAIKVGERGPAVRAAERIMRRLDPRIQVDGVYTKANERFSDRVRAHFHRDKADGFAKGTKRLTLRWIKQKREAAIIAQIPFYHELAPSLQNAAKRAVRMGLVVTSTTHGGHSSTSHHFPHNNSDGKGHAIDVAEVGTGNRFSAKCARFARFYVNKPHRELFYDHISGLPSPGRDHFDHVHLAL